MKSKPLYILAQEHKLPELEIMDQETLDWMKPRLGYMNLNLPSVLNDYSPMPVEEFKEFIPNKEWFLRKDHLNSIHGINHVVREMLYSLLVKQCLNLNISTNDLIISAAIHDIRRANDNEDFGHGERASDWFVKNIFLFSKYNHSQKEISFALVNHEVDPAKLNLNCKAYKNQLLLGLRLADALDRYRQPKEKWWPNKNYFPVEISEELLTFVKSFTYKTEVETLNHTPEDSINILLGNAVESGILVDKRSYWIDKNLNFYWRDDANKQELNTIHEISKQNKVWNEYLIHNAPMGVLLANNNLFTSVFEGNGLKVLHLTSNLEEIIRSKRMLLSGGGLGSCVYGIPVSENHKIHNLGQYISQVELPRFLESNSKVNKIDTIMIDIPKSDFNNPNSIYPINYLDWGEYYLESFRLVGGHLLTDELKKEILHEFTESIFPFQNLEVQKALRRDEFLRKFNQAIAKSPMVRVPYFETLLEYLFLFQDSKEAKKHREIGELYNWDAKELFFDICPKLKQKFSLSNFDITLEVVADVINNSKKIENFSKEKFYNFMRWRFAHNVRFHIMRSNLFDGNPQSYVQLERDCPSIVGYILFRKFKNELNLEKVLSGILLKKWKKIGVKILTYSNLPKGEIGVLPFISNDTKFYSAEIIPNSFKLGPEIKLHFAKEMIKFEKTTMRHPQSQSD